MMLSPYFAHSANGPCGDGVPEALRDHLANVADRCASLAAAFHAAEQARLTGMLHDLGKYAEQFQRRLFDPSLPARDHWSLGALAALEYANQLGHFPAVAILGHHVGLQCVGTLEDLERSIKQQMRDAPDRFTTTDGKAVLQRFKQDGLRMPKVAHGLVQRHDYAADMLDIRMLYSALVDADFLETEAHFAGDAQQPRRPREAGPQLQIDASLAALHAYRHQIEQTESPLSNVRRQLFELCSAAGAAATTGCFTLSAPTGSGKTLSMLAFALEHARRNNLQRIIVVMPFLNIIDQTAAIYRQIFSPEQFGEEYVLEAHSLADREFHDGTIGSASASDVSASAPSDDMSRHRITRRLLAENWDAPIILTTNVTLLESMFAHRAMACRKLHRLARSVILFDEVQTLPAKVAVATLATLARLADPAGPYRSSVVFATATQPAFEALSGRGQQLVDPQRFCGPTPCWAPTEIVPSNEQLFTAAARRVQIQWRERSPLEFDEVAAELAEHQQVLCIVNLKRHARDLAVLLNQRTSNVFHLSTNMCSVHRLDVLAEIAERLHEGKEVRVISTQCVEAGVDLDFPIVYRALAPLEAIAQAAGRCNRSGSRETGNVIVFTLRDLDDSGQQQRSFPPGYATAMEVTQHFLAALRNQFGEQLPEIIHSPQRLREYYRQLYNLEGRDQDALHDERDLIDAIQAGDFVETARQYRLIKENTLNVLVPYDVDVFEQLLAEAMPEDRPLSLRKIRRWIARARPYSVSLFRPTNPADDLYSRLLPIHFGRSQDERLNFSSAELDWWYPTQAEGCYDQQLGLQLAEPQWIM